MVTYKDAGVDISHEDRVIKALVSQITFKRTDIKPAELGLHYAGAVEFGDYYLVLSTDGVGSKMIVAEMANKFDTVGIDMIAMNVNDAICIGAEPVALVDYLAVGHITEEIAEQIGKGLNEGAKEANINIVGGETATLPDMIKGIDLAGTVLAIVKKDEIITGKDVKPGDVIVGLRSSGIHSNGLSLARKVFFDIAKMDVYDKLSYGKTVAEELLTPTRIYVKPVLEMVRDKDIEVKGLAHITGGSFRKLKRLNDKVTYYIDNLPEPLPIFKEIQRLGNVPDEEMFRTFNMGIGFCVIVDEEDADKVIKISNKYNIPAQIIGRVVDSLEVNGNKVVGKSVVKYNDKFIILE
ncbi:phosphoribosylformylglycinamidine cyclo-ligase [Methanocaldococcus bathoardescens]|uniref:Phosphoribosylformylglycinamidine cyclo-ligase n=1 Tax=Methanocaldococcus bathoardescens TaxID=1301915 RepID=A0A076LIU1_9EURY|nr:phosphoribosylformylglycinamidine cyclo-ligase [Methanocaldococcus bathoardescens]AIJ06443.1 phosphoribosylformylglycinamidine cyclo-ligase [Methanocaldococcus bathoardescens]